VGQVQLLVPGQLCRGRWPRWPRACPRHQACRGWPGAAVLLSGVAEVRRPGEALVVAFGPASGLPAVGRGTLGLGCFLLPCPLVFLGAGRCRRRTCGTSSARRTAGLCRWPARCTVPSAFLASPNCGSRYCGLTGFPRAAGMSWLDRRHLPRRGRPRRWHRAAGLHEQPIVVRDGPPALAYSAIASRQLIETRQ